MSYLVPNFGERSSDLRVTLWRNLIVVVDDGNASPSGYLTIARHIKEMSAMYRDGVGCLVVLPPLASPPPEETRRALKEAFAMVSKDLKAVSWLVEGTEFRAAAVRAALAGLRLFMRLPFPTQIAASFEEAVPWMLGKLQTRPGQESDPQAAINYIRSDLSAQTQGIPFGAATPTPR